MRKLLVTGGAGFIGANFTNYWLEKYPNDQVVVLDALTYAGNRDSLAMADGYDHFLFIHGNILDDSLVEKIMREHEIDTIVHFAAESHVDRSISGPDAFIDTNIIGSHVLLKSARKLWLDSGTGRPHHFHHVSTDEVYGTLDPGDPAFSENTPYAPNSPYSASKAASDHLVRAYHHTYGLNTTVSNCSNNYGPYQFPEKLIPLMIINILDGKQLPIYGDGLNIRDWLFVHDHSRAIDMILKDGRFGETYNIGGLNEWTNIDIVRLLCGLLNRAFAERPALAQRFPQAPAAAGESESLITYVKDRPGHDRRYAIDAAKLSNELGFSISRTFEEGIGETIDWYLDHEDWWRRITDGTYRQWIEQNYGER